MAARSTHKKIHKFKKRKAVGEKHKTIRKRKAAVKAQTETEKQQREIQEGIVTAQTPVVATGFPKPYEPTPQEDNVVTPQPQLAQVESHAQPLEPKSVPILSIEKQTQATSAQQTSTVQNIAPPLPEIEPEKKKSKLWIVLVFVIILAIVGGALYYFREEFILKTAEEEKKPQTPAPTPSEVSPTPTPSADVETDPSEYSIKVLNGSGIAGEAAKVKDILEGTGFIVKDIGNADAATYEKTVIKAKEDVSKDFLDLLRVQLGELYLLDANEDLLESEDLDVIIIIGKDKV